VDDYYTVYMYKKAYDEMFYPMPGENQWIKTKYDKVDPSVYKILPGSPRKLRTKSLGILVGLGMVELKWGALDARDLGTMQDHVLREREME